MRRPERRVLAENNEPKAETMAKTLKNTCVGAAAMLILVLTIGIAVAPAQSDSRSDQFAGTWNVRLTIRNCQTGEEIRTSNSIATYMAEGTLIDSTSGIAQALKTPGHGIWAHAGGNSFVLKFKSFSFDPAGNFTGWTIIQHTALLDRSTNTYSSSGTAEIYGPTGTLLATGCSTTTAAKLTFG
jgi:hypothetical protein